MQKENEKSGRSEFKTVDVNSPEVEQYGYKKELNLRPEELAQLGKENGYMRFVRFKNEESQVVVIDAKIDGSFAVDMAKTLKDQPDALETLRQIVKLADIFNGPGGEVVESLMKLRSDLLNRDEPCMCPKCVEKRSHIN